MGKVFDRTALRQRRIGATRRGVKSPGRSVKLSFAWVAPAVWIGLTLGFLSISLHGYQKIVSLPVGEVVISGGARNIPESRIEHLIAGEIGKGFWELELARVKSAIEEEPWVRSANVRRIWPDKLMIGIDEHVPVARWSDQRLLSSTGVIFPVENAGDYSALPLFSAPENQVYTAVQTFNRLQTLLNHYGLVVVRLRGEQGRSWSVDLKNGITIELGRMENEVAQARSLGFLQAFFDLDYSGVASVDLRYPNGLAVGWLHAGGEIPAKMNEKKLLLTRNGHRAPQRKS
jgi:cell division protein FtsQ